MNLLQKTYTLGQSIWIDYIERSFIVSGELQRWISAGVRGLTSNPTIFQKAISNSSVYDEDIDGLFLQGKSVQQIYEKLAIQDIRDAADLFYSIYQQSNGVDGYVSLEVSPDLAYNTKSTIAEAKRLFSLVDRPNLMIKIPATDEGIPAITEVLAAGINVNVTLIFGLHQYRRAAQAYYDGLQRLSQSGFELTKIASVASFFVSRLDTAVDDLLKNKGEVELVGKCAVVNARAAYDVFQDIFSNAGWKKLVEAGGRVQRLLWASTGTKNPVYADTLYVDELIGENTVNTVPPATLKAFQDHGRATAALPGDKNETHSFLQSLKKTDINLIEITDQLQRDGVKAFADSFGELLGSIEAKCKQ